MKLLLLFIAVALIIMSCEKGESDGQITKDNIKTPVFAGIADTSLLYQEFNPPFKVDLKNDTLPNYVHGEGSIDLNLNGTFDISIKQWLYTGNIDTVEILEDNFSYCRLIPDFRVEVAALNETNYLGQGETGINRWVDTIAYEELIDSSKVWYSGYSLNMWRLHPTEFGGSFGCWYDLINTERYIGIRIKSESDYKYGWIKVYQYSNNNIEIQSLALEK